MGPGQEYVDIYAASVKERLQLARCRYHHPTPQLLETAAASRWPSAPGSVRVSERCGVILAVTVSLATMMTASAHHV